MQGHIQRTALCFGHWAFQAGHEKTEFGEKLNNTRTLGLLRFHAGHEKIDLVKS
jgi:hypothetical protein